ncbi:MAG TPA: hypothetical protein VHT73_10415 [Thermodesulfobacteriota bacterium]|nr:hypothetical protein [Thermodesulfobacteriota bacterium]
METNDGYISIDELATYLKVKKERPTGGDYADSPLQGWTVNQIQVKRGRGVDEDEKT